MSGYDFDGVDAHEESVRISGRVKWFDPGKGYGFIVPDDPSQTGLKDVLLHVTSLRQAGRESALEGATISCDVVKRPKGWQVSEIHDLDETSASPMSPRPNRFAGGGGAQLSSISTTSATCQPFGRRTTSQVMSEPSSAFSRPELRRLVTCSSTSFRSVWLGSSGTMKP